MKEELHVVLGAGGGSGQAVVEELKTRFLPYRAVTRSGRNNTFASDVLDKAQTLNSIEGASHVYLCIGFPYKKEVWDKKFEIMMENVINACEVHQAKLIFLDNIYMYGPSPLAVPFDETHPRNPSGIKGKARKRTTDLLLKAMAEGRLEALIARSADFFGPGAVNSTIYLSFLQRMLQNKPPQWLGKPDVQHTFANIADNGRAMLALAMEEDCYGQEWHLPVGEPINVHEIVEMLNQELGTQFKVQVLPTFMRKLLAMFVSPIKELEEVIYMFQEDYVMSYEKFRSRFPDFKVQSNRESLKTMINWFQKNSEKKGNL
ncbi:MAG: NAD-dependent epimerase/dehydratase family protein [Bacteroidia bacterium]|nr:NAD-dependent epimerase/dehydratase family protein [Bacteroidia bacterium]